MNHYDGKDEILVKAPAIHQALRAIYGLTRSPRLWSMSRDEKVEGKNGEKNYKLEQLQSEPNLWKIVEEKKEAEEDHEDYEIAGLLMT